MAETNVYRVVQNAAALGVGPEEAVSEVTATRVDFQPNTMMAILYLNDDIAGVFQSVVKVVKVSDMVTPEEFSV